MTALVVTPTPWHAAALVGGSILRWTQSGRQVVLAVPAADHDSVTTEVASRLGAEANIVPWPSSAWTSDDQGRLALTDIMREFVPDIVVVPPVGASIERTSALGSMAFDAAFCSTVPHYRTPAGSKAGGGRMPIVEFDDPFRVERSPIEYVDTTEVWDSKQLAIAASARTATGWFPSHEKRTSTEVAEIVSRARGLQTQSPHGEAYTQVRVYGRLRAARLMP